MKKNGVCPQAMTYRILFEGFTWLNGNKTEMSSICKRGQQLFSELLELWSIPAPSIAPTTAEDPPESSTAASFRKSHRKAQEEIGSQPTYFEDACAYYIRFLLLMKMDEEAFELLQNSKKLTRGFAVNVVAPHLPLVLAGNVGYHAIIHQSDYSLDGEKLQTLWSSLSSFDIGSHSHGSVLLAYEIERFLALCKRVRKAFRRRRLPTSHLIFPFLFSGQHYRRREGCTDCRERYTVSIVRGKSLHFRKVAQDGFRSRRIRCYILFGSV